MSISGLLPSIFAEGTDLYICVCQEDSNEKFYLYQALAWYPAKMSSHLSNKSHLYNQLPLQIYEHIQKHTLVYIRSYFQLSLMIFFLGLKLIQLQQSDGNSTGPEGKNMQAD